MSIRRRILIDELIEVSHFLDFSEIIHIALTEYAEKHKGMSSAVIASCVSNRITEGLQGINTTLVNPDEIEELLKQY